MPADVETTYRHAVGSAAVEAIVFDEAFLALLWQVADGMLSPDAAVAQLVAEHVALVVEVRAWANGTAGWICPCGRFAGPYGSAATAEREAPRHRCEVERR